MKSISLNMTSIEVKVENRPLRSKWTREMSSGLNVYYNGFSIEEHFVKELRKTSRLKKIIKIFNDEPSR